MRILVIEDEPRLAWQVCDALRAEGHAVDHAADGEDGSYLGASEPYELIVLDLGLPRRDGISVLSDWRRQGLVIPVLILTARDSWREKVEGLDAGADDYLAKPFIMAELLARVRALLRRAAGQANPVLTVGNVAFDTRTQSALRAGVPVSLTAQEAKLLECLMLRPGVFMRRTELAEQIYGYDEERDSNTIEVFIRRLRQKLGADLIVTERGKGYRLALEAECDSS